MLITYCKPALETARKMMQPFPGLLEHSTETATLAMKAANYLGLDAVNIGVAAFLHDIGKTTWSPELFNKIGVLPHEWSLIKAHPLVSQQICSEILPNTPISITTMVRGHHERPEGKGYPDKLKNPGIELLVIGSCDVFSSITSKKIYRSDLSIGFALQEISRFAPPEVVFAVGKAYNEIHRV